MSEEIQGQDVNSRIDRIEVTLSHAVDAIEKIASVVNKPQETKWGPILTAVSLLFVAGSGYTTLITLPMQRENDRLQEQVLAMQERELKDARRLGIVEGRLGIDGDE